MHWEIGRTVSIVFRRIGYMEDRLMDSRYNYRLGFTFAVTPCLKVVNSVGSLSVSFSWLAWELVGWWQKTMQIDYDIQGMEHITYRGLRYYLTLGWLWRE